MQITNYDGGKYSWLWTGVRNLNQVWSMITVTEPIIVESIDVYWGGYGDRTSGKHFIARMNGSSLGGLVASSSVIGVSQGRHWRRASVSPTLLEPGNYAVGVWGNYTERRQFGLQSGDGNATYTSTESSLDGRSSGTYWGTPNSGGGLVIPARLNGEPAGRMSVNVNGVSRKGNAWVNVNGVNRKAKSVWVNVNGIWRRSK